MSALCSLPRLTSVVRVIREAQGKLAVLPRRLKIDACKREKGGAGKWRTRLRCRPADVITEDRSVKGTLCNHVLKDGRNICKAKDRVCTWGCRAASGGRTVYGDALESHAENACEDANTTAHSACA